MNKKCITFSGVIGCSKTPISNYLSTLLNLPVFNNDAIRTEVVEDFGKFNAEEHLKRRNARLKKTVESGISFIADVSIDRTWPEFKKVLEKNGYEWFIISIDLSKKLLVKLYKAKEYHKSMEVLDQFIADHENFIKNNDFEIDLRITDKEFKDRLGISYKAVRKWLKK